MLKKVGIIGRSKVGSALAGAVRESDRLELVLHTAARAKRMDTRGAQVLIIAAKDDEIAKVASRAVKTSGSELHLLVHLAGSLTPDILPDIPGVARLTLHPIQTFAKPEPGIFEGIYFMACSEETAALRWAKQFVKALGGKGVIELPPESLPLYHTLSVFSANFVVLIGGAVEQISMELGQDPKKIKQALRPLMEQVLTNVLNRPATEVLSGPIRRRDLGTIKKHQRVLKDLDPKLRKIYDAFLDYALSHGY